MKNLIKICTGLSLVAILFGFGFLLNAQAAASNLAVAINSPVAGSSVTAGQSTTFSASATGGVAPYTYLWSFADGSVGAGASFAKTLSQTGAQSVTVKVTDSTTNQASSTANFTVATTAGTAPVISGISATNITQTSVTIVWTTDVPSDSRVIFDTTSHSTLGSAPNYGYASSTATLDGTTKVTSHSVNISGLTSSTKYYFRVISAL